MDIEFHLQSFVDAFVEPSRKGRWKELLAKRDRKLIRQSHKLHQALDARFCRKNVIPDKLDWSSSGIYYDFYSEPEIKSFQEAYDEWTLSPSDTILSLIPGRLAFYFFHEIEFLTCQRTQ